MEVPHSACTGLIRMLHLVEPQFVFQDWQNIRFVAKNEVNRNNHFASPSRQAWQKDKLCSAPAAVR